MSAKWTHKVIKTQRGGDGKWFRYPAAATFDSVEAADEYARHFAAQQAEVAGTRILVITRKGDAVVKDYRTEDFRATATA